MSKSTTDSIWEIEDSEPKKRKRTRSKKGKIDSPIVISSSPEDLAALASNTTADTHSLQPRPRNKRRRILESSQSTGGTKGTCASRQEDEQLEVEYQNDGDIAEDQAHHDLSASKYIVRPTPDPSPLDNEEEPAVERPIRGPIIIPLRPEGPYVASSQEGSRPSDTAEIQVPRTQIPRRGRREIPDSQSSRATSIYLTPADQKAVVPETPFERLARRVYSPRERLQAIQDAEAAPNIPSSSLLDDEFADIPDSSNRVFSQDVKELRHQEASQSQSSKDSQKTDPSHQSQNSMPSAQLSFGKIGVAPSTKGSSDRESPVSASGGSATSSYERAVVAAEAAKSVAVVHAAPPSSSLYFDQKPQTQLRPQPQPRSGPAQDDIERARSRITSKTTHGVVATSEESAHSTNSLLNRIDRIAQADSLGILQEAVESRPLVTVDTSSETSAQLPQLEAAPSQVQKEISAGEGDTTESTDSSSQHRAKPADLSVDSEASFPALLSPTTPIREEDVAQGGRSATTTPCGPIPASARPAPVTVLGYSLPQQAGQKATEDEEPLLSSTVEASVLPTSTTFDQVVINRRRQEKPSPPPLRETRSSTRRKRKTSSGEDIMSAAPLSPLPSVDVPAPVAGSSPKRQTRDRSSSHLASPQPADSNPDRSLSGRDSENDHRMDVQYQERTPVAADSPSIDDDLLAGSQVLSLIQKPVESTPDEICLAIPLNDVQIIMYKKALLENYRRVEAFFGIESSQGHTENITIDGMEQHIRHLDAIASHADLSDSQELEYGKIGPKLVKWFCKQSSKFDLLSKLLEKLKNDAYTVAIVAENGRLMDCLDIFMKSTGYSFTRYNEALSPVTPLPDETNKLLHVVLIPSNRVDNVDITLPVANVVIGFDSTLDPASPHIRKLRSNGTASTPIIHFVPVNTVAHIILCLPDSARSSRREYINATLLAAMLIRKYVGILPETHLSYLDGLSTMSLLSWLENLQNTPGGLLPTLQLELPTEQNSSAETHDPEVVSSPSRKRVLSISITPSAAGGKHKKPRVEASQTPASQNEDTPMDDYENAVDEQDVVVEVEDSKSGDQTGSIPSIIDQIGDITHVTGTIPNESARGKEPEPAAVDQDSSAPEAKDTAMGEHAANMQGNVGWGGNEPVSDEDLLRRMSKEDLIQLLLDCKAKYSETKNESKGFETALSLLQFRYEERRQRIRDLKAEAENAVRESRLSTAEAHMSKTLAESAKAERDRAKTELKQFQKAMSDKPEGERTRVLMVQELNELKPRVATLTAKLKQVESELEFSKDRYLDESRQNMTLMRENGDLEEQLDFYKRKADETKVRLKEINLDRERTKYLNKIKELQGKLDKANKHNAALDAEKKRAERSRGLQTRSSSIPPRPLQSSPAPTRSASPTNNHRHPLRGVDAA
ncbi:hypothetical protein TWF696_007177 [Orbilia brochopaga]|uniref:Uncharacterized protein n=1 Tax=Orbilia brochopaga TaxID=3140254 RepID=A0AAV9USL1_9PEZI